MKIVSHFAFLIICEFLLAAFCVSGAVAQTTSSLGTTYIEHSVTLTTPTGVLYGSEIIPNSPTPIPVLLLHAGSGPTDRNGNSRALPGANNSLKLLVEALARNGIASVRYDKRAIGESAKAAASEADFRFTTYVDDAAGWVKQLRADKRFSKIVIAGHSEGALIAMLAAAQAATDGYISIAGIAQSADDVLRVQLKPKLPPDLYAEADRCLITLKAGKTCENPPAALAALFRPSVQPYLISWFKHTPRDIIGSLKLPVLIVQGDRDNQVAVSEANSLKAAAPNARLAVIGGMNHVLKIVGDDAELQKRSYSDSALPVSTELLAVVTAFVEEIK